MSRQRGAGTTQVFIRYEWGNRYNLLAGRGYSDPRRRRGAMRRATLIIGLVGFLAALVSGAVNWQICVPCVALVLGAAAGYFACRVVRPVDQSSATRLGATPGALAGVFTLIGNVVGGLLGAAILGPQGAEAY